jgi:FkbM family methyltransferase
MKLLVQSILQQAPLKWPHLRRLAWRAGRSLYCAARGEQLVDDMRVDGELDLQRRVVEANRTAARFIAFDIGANQGDWTLALIDALTETDGDTKRLEAHVFEPIPTTRERLVSRLGVGKGVISVVAKAASDKLGTLDMIVMSETGGTNSLVYDDAMAKQAKGFIPVNVTTLDRYCSDNGIGYIHLVKCDTEGHDLSVLRGAAGLLRDSRIDIFQFEYNHRWIGSRAFLKDVFDLIDDLPYRFGRVMPSYVELFDAWHPELERYYQSNYVLVRAEALSWLKVTKGRFDRSNTYA